MKIDLKEIWNFINLAPSPEQKGKKMEWSYKLIAGEISIENLTSQDILDLNEDEKYDTELLPSIFTFREILWQPNVYTQPSLCLPQLNILKEFCLEYISDKGETETCTSHIYRLLLQGLSTFCQEALDRISQHEAEVRISSILGDLRKKAFPIVKFFLFHPMNRHDYHVDALNRLNYAVKIMLTQYNNKYDDLENPYWIVEQREIVKKPELDNRKPSPEKSPEEFATESPSK
ncbi:hypothetical protein [Reichenbachiella sp. MALMAid0571]|uniref:hypothetical protein n=1 Tax=Reichenbachiella sp. MALMAid0571 TaxID=3143939 RepID=UPI0032DF5176